MSADLLFPLASYHEQLFYSNIIFNDYITKNLANITCEFKFFCIKKIIKIVTKYNLIQINFLNNFYLTYFISIIFLRNNFILVYFTECKMT